MDYTQNTSDIILDLTVI